MHELGLVIDAVEMTERYAGENNIEQIKALFCASARASVLCRR